MTLAMETTGTRGGVGSGSRFWKKTMNTLDTFKLDVLRGCPGEDIWEAVGTQVWSPRRGGGCSNVTLSDAVQKSSVEGS